MSFKKLLATAASLALTFSLSTKAAEAGTHRGGVLPPFAYIQFCVHHAGACSEAKGRLATSGGGKVEMTSKLQQQLAVVNSSVNSSIRPKARGPGDPWTMGGNFGDCNSYALTKKAKLIAAGWPSSALSLTVVKTSWGEGHLVLSVHTNTGIMVLDNLSHSVRPLSQVPYRLISMQQGSALQWGAGSNSAANTVPDNLLKMTHPHSRAPYRLVAMQSNSAMQHRSTIESVGTAGSVSPSKAATQLSEAPYRFAELQSALKVQWNRRSELLGEVGLPQLVGSLGLVFEVIRGVHHTEVQVGDRNMDLEQATDVRASRVALGAPLSNNKQGSLLYADRGPL